MDLNYKRMLEIEVEFAKSLSTHENRDKALTDMILKIKTIEESEYLYEVYLMPSEEILKEISRYDSSSPKLDELKFVNSLCERYNVGRKDIVKRIKNVRTVNRYLKLKKMDLNQCYEYVKRK